MVGTKLSAADVADTGGRIAAVLGDLGVTRGARVSTLVENSPGPIRVVSPSARSRAIAWSCGIPESDGSRT